MPRTFLTAEWRDLIIASYAVDPALLATRLPPGLELDLFEGSAVCSLVGFRFLNTRVLGVRWPGYINFPEINLRFYVREQNSDRRGVVFVRELVRSRAVASIARTLYNEPYVKAQISEWVVPTGDKLRVEYGFGFAAGVGRMAVEADAAAAVPPEDTAEHWFKEHQWGYGVTRRGRPLRYEVRHPVWACHRVRSAVIEVDWTKAYGPEWAPLAALQPISVVLAQGSTIGVLGATSLQVDPPGAAFGA
tara:strand:+ start:8792 stop:9532 length:741 start_codon:yes stop_codon:yes gene_type:complete